jgi:uncharacterized protein
MTQDPESRLVQLDAQACTRLLAAPEFGRLAVVADGRPVIVVLNYLVDGPDVTFRTDADALLSRLTLDGNTVPAVFEVDSASPVGRSGWSVIAHGLLMRETDPDRCAAARSRIVAWAEGERDTVLRLKVDELSGRQVGPL